ncbi:hypothetical protein [Sphingomonas sp. 28-63-12]|uniref:hypothetical protein n=1 Tax=Sphingomonas sp. 28-63-12 TaxID=1970434 RepID=UPI000BCDDAFE|nr:MAG: hypothetical protein B7Y47_14485 [Sphingomonas sp. 28-63-12]
MNCTCGCCGGLHAVTPLPIGNRPGLAAIHTRIGTQTSFLETMLARLSSSDFPELAGLRTRAPGDASIALIDAWAMIADVLSFYQERIANEGYLRTATERRSLVELARLIGYVPRPGVAASVFLAFGLDKDSAPVLIPQGSKANSIPAPGETMQAFETSETLAARCEWSRIRPRLVQPHTARMIQDGALFLKGIATKLVPGDLLLIGVAGSASYVPRRVVRVDPDAAADRTRIGLQQDNVGSPSPAPSKDAIDTKSLEALLVPGTRAPRNRSQLGQSIGASFGADRDAYPKLLASFEPALATNLYPALRNAAPAAAQSIEVYAMRIEARPFGHNAPLKLTDVGSKETAPKFTEWGISDGGTTHLANTISLDADYEVGPESKIVIEKNGDAWPIILSHADSIRHISINAYGLSGKSVVLQWNDPSTPWLADKSEPFATIRCTRIYAGSERLDLADVPITDDVAGDRIELDNLYDGLDAGRWLIIEGERTDIPDGKGNPIPGIHAAELVMLAGVEQSVRAEYPPADNQGDSNGKGTGGSDLADNASLNDIKDGKTETGTPHPGGPLSGDTYHSVITLAGMSADGKTGLAYRYKRDTVTIYANVAHATHGETRTETLGSGNAAQALQRFILRQPPLTYVSGRTPSGIVSTLGVRVNDVLWHEAATLTALGPRDRKFITKTGDDDKAAVIFGNGERGIRLPTGRENVKAHYRSGIGTPGNVAANQISLLASRPLGVKDVINPIRASGGADREGLHAIRRNAPLAIMALDRLLSTGDYADFARSFGGIGKASATRTRDGVAVVVAGIDDAPIDRNADVFVNLNAALHQFGDAQVPIRLSVRERLSLIVQAGVQIDGDYLWEAVEPQVRAALLATFAFETQDLGAPAFLSHAYRAIQGVRGVVSVDIDVFDAISAVKLLESGEKLVSTLSQARPRINVAANQIAYLAPDVPDTLILQELPS